MNTLTKSITHALLTLSLCIPINTVTAESSSPKVEIVHFWRADSEQKALNVFRQQVIAGGGDWEETAVAGSRELLPIELSKLMALGTPPSIVHWVIDGQLPELIKSGTFTSIPEKNNVYRDLYLPEVYDLISVNDGIISAPVGIHSYNFMVYNKDMLDRFGIKPVSNLSELVEYGPILAKEGVYLTTVSDQGWQTRYPMTSILASILTPDEFRDFFRQSKDIEHLQPKVIEAMRILASIRKYADPDFEDLDWRETVGRINDGKSLVLFMGDFSVPEFANQSNLVCTTAPGSNAMYIGMDSFAFPTVDDPDLQAGQRLFLKITTNPKFVAQYINLKGGLPVIHGVSPDDLEPCHAENLRRWENAEKVWVRGEAFSRRYHAFAQFLSLQWRNGLENPDASGREIISLFKSFY